VGKYESQKKNKGGSVVTSTVSQEMVEAVLHTKFETKKMVRKSLSFNLFSTAIIILPG